MIFSLSKLTKEQKIVIKKTIFAEYMETLTKAMDPIPVKVLKQVNKTVNAMVDRMDTTIGLCIDNNSTDIFKQIPLNKSYKASPQVTKRKRK